MICLFQTVFITWSCIFFLFSFLYSRCLGNCIFKRFRIIWCLKRNCYTSFFLNCNGQCWPIGGGILQENFIFQGRGHWYSHIFNRYIWNNKILYLNNEIFMRRLPLKGSLMSFIFTKRISWGINYTMVKKSTSFPFTKLRMWTVLAYILALKMFCYSYQYFLFKFFQTNNFDNLICQICG